VENFPERSRERFLLPAEMKAFFTALASEDSYWQGFFLLCLFTGSRRGNVASMAWKEIDLQNAVWHLPGDKTKNKRPTSVPLCAPALAILKTRFSQRQDDNPWVFPASKGRGDGHMFDPRKAWVRILAVAKIDDLRIHDLRRSQGSWQAALGISLAIVGKTLGHADLKSTQVYSRLELASVKDAVSRVSTAMLTAGSVVVDGDGVKIIDTKAQQSESDSDGTDDGRNDGSDDDSDNDGSTAK
jgi:integrase